MAVANFHEYVQFLPIIKQIPQHSVWLSYDEQADVLYVNFRKPSYATDSELTDEDVIIRYADEEIIGFTVLNVTRFFQQNKFLTN